MGSNPPPPPGGSLSTEHDSKPLEALIAQRREALKRLRDAGINPYPYAFACTHSAADLLKEFQSLAAEQTSEKAVRTAGRLMTMRDMGKSCFAHLADGTDRLQIYVKKDVV